MQEIYSIPANSILVYEDEKGPIAAKTYEPRDHQYNPKYLISKDKRNFECIWYL